MIFQKDLHNLRLTALRTYAKTLTASLGPLNANISTGLQLKLDMEVRVALSRIVAKSDHDIGTWHWTSVHDPRDGPIRWQRRYGIWQVVPCSTRQPHGLSYSTFHADGEW